MNIVPYFVQDTNIFLLFYLFEVFKHEIVGNTSFLPCLNQEKLMIIESYAHFYLFAKVFYLVDARIVLEKAMYTC